MLKRIDVATLFGALLLFALPSEGYAQLSCGRCISCPGNPLSTGTDCTCAQCQGDWVTCIGTNCVHGGCSNIEGCAETDAYAPVLTPSIPSLFATLSHATPSSALELVRQSRGRLSFLPQRGAIVVKSTSGTIQGVIPVSLGLHLALANAYETHFVQGAQSYTREAVLLAFGQ